MIRAMTKSEVSEQRAKDFHGDYFYVLKNRLDEANRYLKEFSKKGRPPNMFEVVDWENAKFDSSSCRRMIYGGN